MLHVPKVAAQFVYNSFMSFLHHARCMGITQSCLIVYSTAIASCYSRVYQSLANLIRWSDKVMLEGVNCEDKEMVSTVKDVIKAVLDGVKVRTLLAD